MKKFGFSKNHFYIIRSLLYWTVLIVPVAVVTGVLVAFFLWSLDVVTHYRWQHLWIVFLLPVAGILITYLYKKWGQNTAAGNNLIMDEIHKRGGGVPTRMTPLVFISTLLTHLFGGSAGREGTAVQMGGSLASLFAKWYRLKHEEKRILLMCGMAAGFGAVFGTPVTGAVFAMEVLTIGKIKYEALVPCLIASLVAHITCSSLGIQHTRYSILFEENTNLIFPKIAFDIVMLVKVIVAGALFGITSFVFAELSHGVKKWASDYISNPYLLPVAGACLVLLISYLLGTPDYLGLGVTNPTGGSSIVSSFRDNGVTPWSWLWKLLLTVITLSTGFKGGEVTPLFFIGAALGNTLALLSHSPVDLFAGIGFIAVFAGATNTPLACTIMGVELFGGHNIIYYAIACFTAYYFSGHSSIYTSQQMGIPKFGNVKRDDTISK